MKYIKTYEGLFSFLKKKSVVKADDTTPNLSEELINRLEMVCVGTYTINDGVIDVEGHVDLNYMNETKIPFKFGRVSGSFYCRNGHLETLIGCPYYVGGEFDCSSNQLETLEGGPEEVGHDFNCELSGLTSLYGAPAEVGGDFNCKYNRLNNLDMVSNINGDILCRGNNFWHENDFEFHGWCGGTILFKDDYFDDSMD